jgi:hypothetical protein
MKQCEVGIISSGRGRSSGRFVEKGQEALQHDRWGDQLHHRLRHGMPAGRRSEGLVVDQLTNMRVWALYWDASRDSMPPLCGLAGRYRSGRGA